MSSYAARPNKAPTPVVKAIATALQKVMRIAEANMGAPPTLAAMIPRAARKMSELTETLNINSVLENNSTTPNGRAAPVAKEKAETVAA